MKNFKLLIQFFILLTILYFIITNFIDKDYHTAFTLLIALGIWIFSNNLLFDYKERFFTTHLIISIISIVYFSILLIILFTIAPSVYHIILSTLFLFFSIIWFFKIKNNKVSV
ncbi:hypothetical protein [Macrococcus bovicus]|uniref:Uncharacterized protein n=1 Tax=Macrococcus bovicus TaxID=69968 RepID=A0A4R6C0R2_9STAP|nr:hypothetical protein [Macrococcus bovicus]TDM14400.1 hypothetical protein ERX55_05575 [Macrococcus bovicus]